MGVKKVSFFRDVTRLSYKKCGALFDTPTSKTVWPPLLHGQCSGMYLATMQLRSSFSLTNI